MKALVLLLAAGLSTGAAPLGHAAQAPRALTLADFARMSAVADPVCSQDGEWIAYTVESVDLEADEKRTSLWMASFDGKQRLRLTGADASASQARFSPDGRYLSFLATRSGADRPQLYLLDRRGGEPQVLTHVSGTIRSYDWSPDGHRLVLSLGGAEAAENADRAQTGARTASSKVPAPIVIDRLHFKEDGEGYLSEADHARLYLLEVADRQLHPLTTDAHVDDLMPKFSPDGRAIAYYSDHRSDFDRSARLELYLIEPQAGAKPRFVMDFYVPNHLSLEFTADGRRIIYSAGLEPRLNAYTEDALSVVDLASAHSTALAPGLDRALGWPVLLPPESLVALLEDDGSQLPVKVPLSGGSPVPLLEGERVVSGVCSARGRIAVIASSDTRPPELYALEAGALRPLSTHNDALMSELELGAVEDVSFPSRDGTIIHGLLVKPLEFAPGRTYPTLLWIHGGPNLQEAHALRFDSDHPHELERQWFAAHGYLVLSVNYRGSSGRGAAFARAIFADWGNKEIADLRAGIDYAVGAKLADPARLGVGGWSYGAILTDFMIASDARFKAAIAGAGSADPIAMYGSDEYILQYNAELGPPWRTTPLWLRMSYPFLHADRIRTPTLFMGGDKDFNVPIGGSEQMYEALRTLEIPTQLVIYPGQFHMFSRPSYIEDRLQRFLTWFDRYLGGPAA